MTLFKRKGSIEVERNRKLREVEVRVSKYETTRLYENGTMPKDEAKCEKSINLDNA